MITITITSDVYAYGVNVTREDIQAYASQIATELCEALGLTDSEVCVRVAPTRYTRIVEGGSADLHSAVCGWLRDTQGGDGWLATMARALGEDA